VVNPANEFLRNKKQEWEEYRSEVTAFELRNLLPVL
jgi:glutamine synthetase